MKKIKVAVLFGGKSVEHEVSLQSAKNVIDAINKDKYDITLIGIDKNGEWHLNNLAKYLINENNPKLIKLNSSEDKVGLIPGNEHQLIKTNDFTPIGNIDVVFSVIHGATGEDGVLQGFLRLAEIPFVGPDVLSSAVCMDKDFAKRLLRDANIPISNFVTCTKNNRTKISFDEVEKKLGLPLFIKPANLGSSVGISKVRNQEEFDKALDLAFQFDTKILIEEFINGKEIECSVMGNEEPLASVVGEIIPTHDFYSYDAKYIDDKGAMTKIPADISEGISEIVRKMAIETYKTLGCEGMARVDFFLTEDNKICVNEVNTIPGFTKISMYPKMWETSGISYSELIDKLITYAIERDQVKKQLKTSV
ncbi:MAG: D-alanine--D-alanine ligase [Cyanobacteriota bacterium]